MRKDYLGISALILAIVLLASMIITAINRDMWYDELERVAEECYNAEHNITTVVKRQKVLATYTVTEDVIIVEVENERGLTFRKTDFNKSKIVGEYIGKKLKQGIKGFKEGFAEESKFER